MGKCIDIVPPKVSPRQSRRLDEAVRYSVADFQLERAAIRDRDLDGEIAVDWLAAFGAHEK